MSAHIPEGQHIPEQQIPATPEQQRVEHAQQTPQQEQGTEQLQSREQQEQRDAQPARSVDDAIQNMRRALGIKKKQKPTKIPQVRDEMTVQIEHIMEEGLKDAFKELSPAEAQEFKIKGEETALQIRNMMRKGKVKVKKIFTLLIEWLKLLPGVNRFFLEQEAKIKTDKIISINRMNHKQ